MELEQQSVKQLKILTPDNYYEDDEYMSVSTFKKMSICEIDGRQVYNREPTDSMMVGSYVDAYVEGTLDKFKTEHPEIIASRGKNTGELKVEFQMADRICQHIENDRILKQFLSGEKQTIMTGFISGVPFKIKMDSYSPHVAINDLKVMKTVTNRAGDYYDFITQWGYDIQLGCYQEIVFQNTGEKLPCFIVALTKEEPINSVIVQIPQLVLDKALYKVQGSIEHLYDIKIGTVEPVGCGKCSACIALRKETPLISMEDMYDFYVG